MPIFTTIEVPYSDEGTLVPPPARNMSICCAAPYDQIQDNGNAADPNSDDPDLQVMHPQIRGMLHHEWRMYVEQDIVTANSPLATTPIGQQRMITSYVYSCIHCTILARPKQMHVVPTMYELMDEVERALGERIDKDGKDKSAVEVPGDASNVTTIVGKTPRRSQS